MPECRQEFNPATAIPRLSEAPGTNQPGFQSCGQGDTNSLKVGMLLHLDKISPATELHPELDATLQVGAQQSRVEGNNPSLNLSTPFGCSPGYSYQCDVPHEEHDTPVKILS